MGWNTMQPWGRPCGDGGLGEDRAILTGGGAIFERRLPQGTPASTPCRRATPVHNPRNPSDGVACHPTKSLPKTTEGGLARLRSAMEGEIDTAEIPEAKGAPSRVRRDASGRIETRKRPSLIREAILKELGRRQMTRYELWKAAREHCATLPQSAVHEYLRGQRE